MRAALGALGTTAAFLWWSPTIAAGLVAFAAGRVELWGVRHRNRRARRLIDRGRIDEAERVLTSLRRGQEARERRQARWFARRWT